MVGISTISLRKSLAMGIAMAFGLGASAAALAQTVDGPKVEWKLGVWGKPRSFTVAIETLKKYVEQKSGGKFSIHIGYETFGGPKELLDLVKVGAIQAATVTPSYQPDKLPALGVLDLAFLPFAADLDVTERVHEAIHKHPFIQKELAGWNARPYMSAMVPEYEFVGRGKPPKSLKDFKGMRVRALGGPGVALSKLGAVLNSVDATEVYTSLERGALDAVLFPLYGHAAYKLNEIGNWYTENLAPGSVGSVTIFNIDAWNKLPPAYKKLTEEAKPVAYAAMKAAYKKSDEASVKLFRKNLTFVKFTDAELEQFRAIGGKPLWDEWAAQAEARGIPGKELLTLMLNTAKQK